ncbi:MAG: nucleotidyl transferase AbiEii/AbiGii toxin family protein [Campylobacteraceae bacterium]|jgi:predicted nucleotidyltransferase component of viral defense system|nr:nucleotidyl transferase AbiEii/AbiGii toxin family protein [Campylobacteraceae bacterium]
MQICEIKNIYKEQINALNHFLDECIELLPNKDLSLLRFGGGTALAIYYFQHRKSYDVDIFTTDPQVLDCIRPRFWLEESRYFKSDDYIEDLNHHVRFMTKDNIKVDILVAQDFISKPLVDTSKELFKYNIYIESIEDILAKKIVHRGSQNKSRDIADIAVAIHNDKNILDKLLKQEAINENDIKTIYKALKTFDMSKYRRDIEYIQPAKEYENTIINAKELIVKSCDNIFSVLKIQT